MASYKNEWVITSYSAVKYNAETKATTAYTPSAAGVISVTANDVIKFLHPSQSDANCTGKFVQLENISIYSVSGAVKVQINNNSANPIYITEGASKSIEGMPIDYIKVLTTCTIYYDGVSTMGILPQ